MTETTPETRDDAKDTVAMTAATMGHDIVAAMLEEFRTLPDHWTRLNAELQQKTIERLKEKTAAMVRKALGFMLSSNFAAVSADLDNVSKNKSIRARLTIPSNAMFRHALFDAQGGKVLVVITDPDQWLQRMEEIKARGDQLELFNPDANYDPERDQPGYRRDRDPFAPGKSLEELKRDLGVCDTKGAKGETNTAPDETEPAEPDTTAPSLTPEQEHLATLQEFRERLAGIGCDVSLGELQSRTDADILAASLWFNWYTSEGIGTPFMERPAFLPEPPHSTR